MEKCKNMKLIRKTNLLNILIVILFIIMILFLVIPQIVWEEERINREARREKMELIVEAEDEGDAESQALGLWDWGNVDMEVEEDE